MAQVTAKFELMQNAFPAHPLVDIGRFFVAEDDHGEHMIFSVTKRGQLCLILKGENGHNELVSLSEKMNIQYDLKVTTLAVSQNANGQIHLVFSVRQSNGLDKLYVVRPLPPTRAEWTRTFAADDFYSGDQGSITIREIMLGASNDRLNPNLLYPQLFLVFSQQGSTTEDIWPFMVDSAEKRWQRRDYFEMPCNPKQIIDKAVGNLRLYRGMYVLYKEDITNKLQLRFVGINPAKPDATLQAFAQDVPEGATCITALENSDGYTDLLVSGKQLTWKSANEWFREIKTPFQVLETDPMLASPSQSLVAQTSEGFSIWSLGQDSLLAYQEFKFNRNAAPTRVSPAIPLLDKKESSDHFAALLHPKLGQKLFVIDTEGAMKMLEQTLESRMWQSPVDIMIPRLDEVTQYLSHTIQVKLTDKDSGVPMALKPLSLRCSSTSEMIVNGASVRGSPNGLAVKTDESGMMTIIVPTDGLSAPIFTLENSADMQVLSAAVEIDAMSKLWKTVEGFKSGKDIKDMKLPTGESLVKPGISDSELDKAANVLNEMSKLRKDISSGSSLSDSNSSSLEYGQSTELSVEIQLNFGDIGNAIWGAFRWVAEKVREAIERGKEAVRWFVRKVKDAWEFVIDIADKTWNFVLKTVQQVASAMQKVMEWIGKGWDWLKKQFEFLFSWGDILKIKNVFVNYTTQGLLMGVDGIALLEIKTDEFFEDIKSKVRQLKNAALPSSITKLRPSKEKNLENETKEKMENQDHEDTLDSPQGQYGNYHLKHSSSSVKDGPTQDQTAFTRLLSRLQAVFGELENLTSRLKDNLVSLFSSSDVSVEQLITKLGLEMLEDILGVLQKLVVGIIGSLGDLILEIVDSINKPISIPVLSPLYKWLTNGADLTMLDLVGLCVAIPATLIFKLATGKRPDEIPGIGNMVEYNAMKSELDQRMGRLRSTQTQSVTEQSVPLDQISVLDIEKGIGTREVVIGHAGTDGSKSVETSSTTPNQSENSMLFSTKDEKPITRNLTPDQQRAWAANRKRFAGASGTISEVIKVGVPGAAQLWYTFVSFPSIFAIDTPRKGWLVAIATSVKLIIWFAQFASIAEWTSEKLKGKDFAFPWDDPQFKWRFIIWLTGGFGVITSFFSKKLAYSLALLEGVVQAMFLLLLQWTSHTLGMGYSTYLACEEWAKSVSKIASSYAGMIGGYTDSGVSAGIGCATMLAGSIMNITRSILEIQGKRDALCSGMDFGV